MKPIRNNRTSIIKSVGEIRNEKDIREQLKEFERYQRVSRSIMSVVELSLSKNENGYSINLTLNNHYKRHLDRLIPELLNKGYTVEQYSETKEIKGWFSSKFQTEEFLRISW